MTNGVVVVLGMCVGFFEYFAYRIVSYGVRLEGTYCMEYVLKVPIV